MAPDEPDQRDEPEEPDGEPLGDVGAVDDTGIGQEASEDAPTPAPDVPHTGDLAVDEALSRLAEAADLPLEEQVGTFDAVHRTLQDRLADVDG
jgi:hypothetical protein